MADRYLRASGNWNGPVWAATSSGVAGSAATPTTSDTVYIAANYTVTLTADAECFRMDHSRGSFNMSSYRFKAVSLMSRGSNSRSINLGSGTLELENRSDSVIGGTSVIYGNPSLYLESSGLSFSAGSSLIILRHGGETEAQPGLFVTGNQTFNDVQIDLMGHRSVGRNSAWLNVIGSPTLRSLTIQSKNSAAHTVNFDGTIETDKFVAIGSSESNRLTLHNDTFTNIVVYDSSYGQFVNADGVGGATGSATAKTYLGSNSVQDVITNEWLLQDPPKSSTLITEFNSLSGWQTQAVGSGYVNTSGGTLNMGWGGGSAYTRITSKDTYDLVNDTFYMKVNSSTGGLFMRIVPVAIQGEAATVHGTEILASSERYWRINSTSSGDIATLTMSWFDNGTWVDTYTKNVHTSQLRSVRFQIDGTRNMNSASLVVDSVGVGPFPTQPEADFSATPTTGKRPVTVNFTDLTKGIPDTWSWNFGDGYTSTQQNPSHPYSKAGTYTVSLTASNIDGTDTVTKSALITIQPEVFSRTAGGTFLLGGTTTRRLIASRTAGGTFLLGGTTRAVLIRDAEAVQDKTYLYKVYDPDGNFIEVWKDVADEPQFTHEINSIGSSMTVELARNSDTVGTTTSPILDDDGQAILDDTGLPILGSMETRNQIGAGTSVDYNNRVDIVAFYGSSEPLHDDEMDEILDDNDEAIITEIGAPNGRRIFTGFISEINSRYGNTESTVVQLTSYGFDLDQYAITTSGWATTVPFLSKDPSQIAREAIDKFRLDSSVEVRRNLITNPQPSVAGDQYWANTNTGGGTVTTGYDSLGFYSEVTTAGTTADYTHRFGALGVAGEAQRVPVTAGTTFTCTFEAMSTVDDARALALDFYNSSNGSLGNITINGGERQLMPANEWVKFTVTAVVPAGAASASVAVLYRGTSGPSSVIRPVGSRLYQRRALFEEVGTELPYFDGNSQNAQWNGAPNASTSSLLKSQTYTKRTSDSIATTGTQVSYTFRNNTYKEVLDKVLELMPSNWYYRVGLGDNTVYFRERSNTPQHLFYLGKHIKSLDLKGSIMDVTNHVLFTGGGDPALYIEEKQAPAARTRRGLEVISDSRVTLDTSARIIAQGKIDAGNKMQNRSTIEILAKQYNIEEIQVGHVVGFRNFNSYVDNLELIVAGVSYSPDIVQLSLQRLPPTVNKRLSDITRNLSVQESNNIPTTPS